VNDLFPHGFLGSVVLILLRQNHGEPAGSSSRNDSDLMYRICLRQDMSNNGMPGFMVCSQLSFFFADDTTLLFRSCDHLGDRFFYFFHTDLHAVSSGCQERSFIQHVFNVRRGKSRRSSGQDLRIDSFCQRLVSGMDPEDFFSSYDIRDPDDDLTVESARTQQCRVKYIRTVGRSQDDDSCVLCEAIHFDQQLVEGLFPFIVSAAKTCASLTTYRIDLIDEYDTRSILLSLIEQVSYTGCSDADKHFNEVGTTDGKERHTGFSGSRLGNIRFTGSRRTYQQDSLRDPCPQTVIFSRMTEKINDFFQFLFFFLQTCDVLKGDLAQITALLQLGSALAKGHRLASSATLVHDEDEEHHHDADHDQRRQQTDPDGFLLRLVAVEFQRALVHLRHDIRIINIAQIHGAVDVGIHGLPIVQLSRHLRLRHIDAFHLLVLQIVDHRGCLDFFFFLRRIAVVEPYHGQNESKDDHIDPDIFRNFFQVFFPPDTVFSCLYFL